MNSTDGALSFQARVQSWILACFGAAIAADTAERNHRFLEEALELVQSCGCTQSEAHQLVDYVFGRPVGEKAQETGGVMVTLAALCSAQGIDIQGAGETELARVWTKIGQIRAKQAAKPKHSPLPEHPPYVAPDARYKRGAKVTYLGRNGLDCDKTLADKHLVLGKVYTIADLSVGSWSSTFWLEEVPDVGFNSVMFADASAAPVILKAHALCEERRAVGGPIWNKLYLAPYQKLVAEAAALLGVER